jgi:hypothetical protein
LPKSGSLEKVDLTSNDFIENSNMYIFLWSGYIHLSEKLFDDDIGIEILAEIGIAGSSIEEYWIGIVDDDGTILFKERGLIKIDECPGCGLHSLNGEAKLIITNHNREFIKIFSLPGKIYTHNSDEEISLSSSFNLYPNPTNDFFSITTDHQEDISGFIVYDLFGNKLFEKNGEIDKRISTKTLGLSSGNYLVAIKTKDSITDVRKLLIIK